MNFFELIYNFNTILGIIFLISLVILTINAYEDENAPGKKRHLIISLFIELLLLGLLIYGLRSFSSTSKTVIGVIDVIDWFI